VTLLCIIRGGQGISKALSIHTVFTWLLASFQPQKINIQVFIADVPSIHQGDVVGGKIVNGISEEIVTRLI
jgi:hypothetical protein